jgi:hypothetical protein
VAASVKRFGAFDVLVNNPANTDGGSILETASSEGGARSMSWTGAPLRFVPASLERPARPMGAEMYSLTGDQSG